MSWNFLFNQGRQRKVLKLNKNISYMFLIFKFFFTHLLYIQIMILRFVFYLSINMKKSF